MLKASTPISPMRATVDGASFVCSVETSKWPVSAASTAMPAVLVVADFTDEDDVRVHAEVAAERARKREADGPVHLHWLMPVSVYSMDPRRSGC